jgi:hypothetical protein
MGTLVVNQYSKKESWIPTELSSLQYWYDASDLDSIVLSGSKVTQWDDKSVNQYHVTQSDDSLRPSLVLNAQNGLPGLDWGSSANSKALRKNSIDLSTENHFAVVRYTGILPIAGHPAILTSRFFNNVGDLQLAFLPGNTWYAGAMFHNGSNVALISASDFLGDPFIVRSNIPITPSTSHNIVIGMDRTLADRGWQGQIYEVLSVGDMTENEIQLLTNYLSVKWGIPLIP